MVPRTHVDGRVDYALVGDLERSLDLSVDEVADGARAGCGEPLLRQMTPQRQLGRRHLRDTVGQVRAQGVGGGARGAGLTCV